MNLSICLQSWVLVIHLYIHNWMCCINQIPVLNGAFHGTLIRPDATRQQLYLLVSCSNKPHLKQTTLTFRIRCLWTAANNNSPGSGGSAPRSVYCHSAVSALLVKWSTLFTQQLCSRGAVKEKKKLKEAPPPNEKRISPPFLLCVEEVWT